MGDMGLSIYILIRKGDRIHPLNNSVLQFLVTLLYQPDGVV
jgi:hypothetical protein